MATTIDKNSTHFLEVLVTDGNNNRVDGLAIAYKIIRSSDDVQIQSGSLTEIGNGTYKVGISINTSGQYRIDYTLSNGYPSRIETLLVVDPTTSVDTTTPAVLVFPSELVIDNSQGYMYKVLVDAGPGTQSQVFNIMWYTITTLVVRTTGQVDVLVSNDGNMFVTKENVASHKVVDVSDYGYVKCLGIAGLSSVSIYMKK